MNHAQIKAQLIRAIDSLSTTWLNNHAMLYLSMDADTPTYAALLKQIVPPASTSSALRQLEPIDPFYAYYAGGRAFWLLAGQRIGCRSAEAALSSLAEYKQLWADALALSDQFKALTGVHYAHLPMLWTLEASPPHFYPRKLRK